MYHYLHIITRFMMLVFLQCEMH